MRSTLLFVLVLAALPAAHAQTLTGRVADPGGAPLPGVNVAVPALDRGTITDASGQFALPALPADTLTVLFSFVGYERAERVVDLTAGDAALDVVLRETIEALEAVTVREDRAREALARAPQSVAVLEAEELDALRGQTLGQTLKRLPGVTTLSTGPSIQKPVIRGLHSDRVIVVNDGIPQEGQQWGAEHAPEIDPFSGARIEVVRGAAGVEYGAGAIGGVVRIEDEALPVEPGWGGQATVNAFSSSAQAAGSLELEGSPTAVPGLGVRVQGSLRRAGDTRTPDYVLGNTAFFERSAEVAVGYTRGAVELEAHASHFGTDLGVYRGAHFNTFEALDAVFEAGRPPVEYAFDYAIDAPKQEIAHDIVALRGRVDLGEGARAEVQYGFQQNRRKEFDADRIGGRDPLARPAFDLELLTHTLDTKVQTRTGRAFGGDAFGVVGLSGMTQGNRSAIGYLIPNFRSYTGGAWARGTWARGPLTLETGGRLDGHWQRAYPRAAGDRGDFVETTRTWTGASGAVGAIWAFAPTWSLAANGSAAWRPPSVNELYSYGIHHGTAQFEIGTPGLGPETSLGLDATLRHATNRTSFELSAYATRIVDYLYLDPTGEIVVTVRGVFPEFRHAQTDARLLGFDGAASHALGRFRFGATAAVVHGTDTDADQPLLQMPADRLGLSAAYRLPAFGAVRGAEVEFGATLVRRQDRYPTQTSAEGEVVPVDYRPPPDGYALFRVGVEGALALAGTPVRFSLTVENLLDTAYRDYLSRYRYFAHDPGRNVVLRLQVPLGGS
ncbi:MAG: TonB-dependent receptor [Rhodothermales bacterium]